MPAIAVTNSGQMIAYFDTDPQDLPPSGIDGVNYANAHGGKLFQISEPCSFSMPIIKDRTYYTSFDDETEDERFKIQGVFRVIQVTTLPGGSALGSFSIDYSCALELPQMANNQPTSDVGIFSSLVLTQTLLNYTTNTSNNVSWPNLVGSAMSSSNNIAWNPTLSTESGVSLQYAPIGVGFLGFGITGDTNPLALQNGVFDFLIHIGHSAGTCVAIGISNPNFLNINGAAVVAVLSNGHSTATAALDCYWSGTLTITGCISSNDGVLISPKVTTAAATFSSFHCMIVKSSVARKIGHTSSLGRLIQRLENRLNVLELHDTQSLNDPPSSSGIKNRAKDHLSINDRPLTSALKKRLPLSVETDFDPSDYIDEELDTVVPFSKVNYKKDYR